jgi:hypothetical protein
MTSKFPRRRHRDKTKTLRKVEYLTEEEFRRRHPGEPLPPPTVAAPTGEVCDLCGTEYRGGIEGPCPVNTEGAHHFVHPADPTGKRFESPLERAQGELESLRSDLAMHRAMVDAIGAERDAALARVRELEAAARDCDLCSIIKRVSS